MTWFNLTGDARLGRCDTEGCGGQPTWRLETCGIGSNYCSGCKEIIASPTPRHDAGALLKLLQASSCFRGDVCSSLPCACAESLARQAASQGSAGGERTEVRTDGPDDILTKLRSQSADASDWNGEVMKNWDKIRGIVETHHGSDLPRLMFEGLVESLTELMDLASDEIERLRASAQAPKLPVLDPTDEVYYEGYEQARSDLIPPRGNYEGRHPSDMVLHPLSEIREWDEALAVLGIQDSDQTPADAIRERDAEIERLRACAQGGQVTPEIVAAVKAAACGGCGAYPYEDCKRGVPDSCFRLHHGGGYLAVPSAEGKSHD